MHSTVLADVDAAPRSSGVRRLFVTWRDPATRTMHPVGSLVRRETTEGETFEFGYLRRAEELEGFKPFIGFPSLDRLYRAEHLFPFFGNRLMPRTREDYSGYVDALGLPADADPFEILARYDGRRATDTIEVFPEPEIDANGTVSCRFLVRGVRHIPGAHDVIDTLTVGDELHVQPEPGNTTDALAVQLQTGGFRVIGYVPAFLTSLVHRPLEAFGRSAVKVAVAHVGHRTGPPHFRLLCHLTARWPDAEPPLSGPDFQPMVDGTTVALPASA